MRGTFLITALILLSTVSLACHAESSPFISIATDKSAYRPQAPIAMAITILNQNSRPAKFTMPTSQIYDFHLYQDQNLIWQWSGDKIFAQAISSLNLEPQKPLTYVYLFNPVLASGKPLGPGRYQLIGVFCSIEKVYSRSQTIEIKE